MSKKMMLLALTVVSAALFALPVVASAAENHLDTVTSFTGSGGPGELKAAGEPTITCESTEVNNGTVSEGGTTGTMVLDFKGCHINILGFTVACKTAGSAVNNTIASGGTFHLITWKNAAGTAFPAVLVTAQTTEVVCAGTTIHVEGDVIGTVTKPGCGGTSNELTLSFTSTGSTQDHIEYTGKKYDLKAKTSGGSQVTAGLVAEVTLKSPVNGTLTCT